jgi:hypothetical protein
MQLIEMKETIKQVRSGKVNGTGRTYKTIKGTKK